jgi:hypothetical protein
LYGVVRLFSLSLFHLVVGLFSESHRNEKEMTLFAASEKKNGTCRSNSCLQMTIAIMFAVNEQQKRLRDWYSLVGIVKISCSKGAPPSMKTRSNETREKIAAKGRA